MVSCYMGKYQRHISHEKYLKEIRKCIQSETWKARGTAKTGTDIGGEFPYSVNTAGLIKQDKRLRKRLK